MVQITRLSPVRFDVEALETIQRDYWTVALKYEDEGEGPYLVDLSHKTRWDVQDRALDEIRPCNLDIPPEPGQCSLQDGILINRQGGGQAAVWHLGPDAPDAPDQSAYTDVTEAALCLALFGKQVFTIAEKLTALDLFGMARETPCLVQGPFSHVPCQIVVVEKNDDLGGGLLLTCSRGYGRSMVQAVLEAGHEFGLRPAGEERFDGWIKNLTGQE